MALLDELRIAVIESLNLTDVPVESITRETTFFRDGLGLDSIDILELVVTIEQKWGVRIDSRDLGQRVFRSMGTLVDHIAAEQTDIDAIG